MVSVSFGIGRKLRLIFSFGFVIRPKPRRWFSVVHYLQILPISFLLLFILSVRFDYKSFLKSLSFSIWMCDLDLWEVSANVIRYFALIASHCFINSRKKKNKCISCVLGIYEQMYTSLWISRTYIISTYWLTCKES